MRLMLKRVWPNITKKTLDRVIPKRTQGMFLKFLNTFSILLFNIFKYKIAAIDSLQQRPIYTSAPTIYTLFNFRPNKFKLFPNTTNLKKFN